MGSAGAVFAFCAAGRGRGPPPAETRAVLNRVLWILRTGALIDGSFASAKKGGLAAGKTKRGNGTKIMAKRYICAPVVVREHPGSQNTINLA